LSGIENICFSLIKFNSIKTKKNLTDGEMPPQHDKLSKMFPFLTTSDIDDFLYICHYKTFKNKETIFQAGTSSRKAALVLSGVTRGYFINKNGVEKNIMLRVEGDFISLPEWFLGNSPTKYSFEAILTCELLVFNLADIEALAKKNPAIFDLYIRALKETIIKVLGRIESLIDLTPEERYKELLDKHPQLFQSAFNKHIANFLGITPVSLSRIIKRMKEK
jgi:CRP-like cAMP-binding protein